MMKNVLAAVLLTATWAANAVDYSDIDDTEPMVEYVVTDEGNVWLAFDGLVSVGSSDRIQEAIDNAVTAEGRKPTHILLNSYGGYQAESEKAMKIIRDNDIITVVAGDGICYSACADMWLAGKVRVMKSGAEIGFHQGFLPISHDKNPYRKYLEEYGWYTLNSILVGGELNNLALVLEYGIEHPSAFIRELADTDKDNFWMIDGDSAMILGNVLVLEADK